MIVTIYERTATAPAVTAVIVRERHGDFDVVYRIFEGTKQLIEGWTAGRLKDAEWSARQAWSNILEKRAKTGF